jgi:hypothetical protein
MKAARGDHEHLLNRVLDLARGYTEAARAARDEFEMLRHEAANPLVAKGDRDGVSAR